MRVDEAVGGLMGRGWLSAPALQWTEETITVLLRERTYLV